MEQEVHFQLDTLLALSQALHSATMAREFDSVPALLEERGKLVRELASMEGLLSPEQLETVKESLQLGTQARLPIAASREHSREELHELRRRRQAQQALKPAPRRGSRLDVSG